MKDQGFLDSFRSRGLRAWQAVFAASFLELDSPTFHLLAGPPGTGKTYTGVAIAAELVLRGTKRILVLAPGSLCEEWRARLAAAQGEIPVSVVTKRLYREMQAAVPVGKSPWSADCIYVISQDFAKQSDVATDLSEMNWDLVIIDEAHRFGSPQRAALLDQLMSRDAVRRLLLLSATRLPFDQWPRLPHRPIRFSSPLTVTDWFGELKNWDGSTLDFPRVDWLIVPYTRGADEVKCLLLCMDLLKALETASGGNKFLVQTLTQRASSSLFAFEESLQRLGHTLRSAIEEVETQMADAPGRESDSESDSETIELPIPTSSFTWADRRAGLAVVTQCLEALERVGADEKLNALKRLIRSILDEQQGESTPKICVLSSYVDTLSYLHSGIDDFEVSISKVTGATSFTERQTTVDRYLKDGGIMLATDAALDGMAMSQVTYAVHYDLPPSPRVLEQRRGRFDRFGRKLPLTMHVFRDESGTIPLESDLLASVTSPQTFRTNEEPTA